MKCSKHVIFMIGLFVIISCYIVSAEGAETNINESALKAPSAQKIKLHYTLTVEGKVIDSSKKQEPIVFQVGNNQVIPGFEKAVKGMKVGEKKSFQVSPQEGYGEEDTEAIQEVSRDQLSPEVKPAPGMTLYARGKDGSNVLARIIEVKKDVVVLNFNHPLAGKTLNFEVEVIEVF
jgi:FKBP-type peptidyl-prolyl cis-trans isomerase 2